ncbi:MAG TPA: Ig-like domain-containing protein, partial [Methylococcales bacterium]
VGKLENLVNQSNGEKILNLNIPLKEKETLIKVSQSYENITLRDTGLTQAAPIVVMVDSDGDGVPDDIEKRLGTKPNDKDTDGDGYKDGEELQHGYNPLGDGKKEMGLSPVERAIILDQALEHPTTSGEEDPGLTVADAKANYDEDGKESGYVFSGKADANTVVTLYVYSDIPIVATVITDEYGNWKYDFATLLSDGEHEIYAVINDETGKIVKKSSPISFLIQKAQAATETEPTTTQPAPEATSDSINYYLFAAIGLALLGITIFLVTIVKSKMDKPKAPKNQPAPKQQSNQVKPSEQKKDS